MLESHRCILSLNFGGPRVLARTMQTAHRRARPFRRIASLLVAMSIWYGSIALGQADPNANGSESWHFGYDLFQLLFEQNQLRVLAHVEQAFLEPEDSVVVVLGDATALDWGEVQRFVRAGGAILVASDWSFRAQGFGSFRSSPVVYSFNMADQYAGFRDCLKIPPTPRAAEEMKGVQHLVTNRSGWFQPDVSGWLKWKVAASFPLAGCAPAEARRQALIAIGRAGEPGVAIVSADASLFTNGMLWHGDNAVAAIRISELLCGESRTSVAFQIGGRAQDPIGARFTPPPPEELPQPGWADVMSLANAVANEVVDSNVLNEALRQQPRRMRPRKYYQTALRITAVAFMLYVVWRLLTRRPLRSVLACRRKMDAAFEIEASGYDKTSDFRRPAGDLARELCWELTGSRQAADWQMRLSPSPGDESPLNSVDRQSLSRVVDIACRGCQSRLSSGEFLVLGKSINRLREKYADTG